MHSFRSVLILLYFGLLSRKVNGSTLNSQTISKYSPVEKLPIQNVADFIDKLIDKYSIINDEMGKAIESGGQTLSEVFVHCNSSRASELRAEKETFDYCHNLTVQITELKMLTINSMSFVSDLSYSASLIVTNGIGCYQKTSTLSQMKCYISLFRFTRQFLVKNVPKIISLAKKLKVMADILTIDALNCFVHHNIDQQIAKEIVFVDLICDNNEVLENRLI